MLIYPIDAGNDDVFKDQISDFSYQV